MEQLEARLPLQSTMVQIPYENTLGGFAMFNTTPKEQDAAAADINRWLSGGQLRANIGREMPLSETAAAHRLQEENTLHKAGTLAGKIILRP